MNARVRVGSGDFIKLAIVQQAEVLSFFNRNHTVETCHMSRKLWFCFCKLTASARDQICFPEVSSCSRKGAWASPSAWESFPLHKKSRDQQSSTQWEMNPPIGCDQRGNRAVEMKRNLINWAEVETWRLLRCKYRELQSQLMRSRQSSRCVCKGNLCDRRELQIVCESKKKTQKSITV